MAAASFSIREYAASMRGGAAAAEALRPFGITDLPPMEAPRFRWWAHELASAIAAAAAAAAASPRKAKPPKERSISDLFAAAHPVAAPPAGESGGDQQPEVDDDEALCAIVRRTKEMKRKRRLQEEEEAAKSAGAREAEGNFATRKEALDKPNSPDGVDSQPSEKTEALEHLRKERENISKKPKQGNNNNMKKNDHKIKCTESKNAKKRGILKKYTKHTSVKMVTEKHGNSKGNEVIEVCRKSVKRVKFSDSNDILGSNMQSSELPKQRSLLKLLSDAMASSSSSSSSSSSTSAEGDKCVTAESSNPHMPEEAFAKTKETNNNTDLEDSPELCSTELSSPWIDLNKALSESTGLDYTHDSNSEVPNLELTHDQTVNSDVQLLDGREKQRNLSFSSHLLESQTPAADLESTMNSRSRGTFLHGQTIKMSDTHIVGPQLSLGELPETHRTCSDVPVKDILPSRMLPCELPGSTFQDSCKQHQNWCSTNMSHGGSQLSPVEKSSSWQSRECNLSGSKEFHFCSEVNVQQEFGPSTGPTVRLMGKDLTVCTTRAESSVETAQKHTGTSICGRLKTNVVLELPRQAQPVVSSQAQSFPNVTVNATSTIHSSTYHASTSQAYFGYRTPHDFRHPSPAANVFAGHQLAFENRFGDFTNSQTNQPVLLGCPPLPNHGTATFPQNSPRPWSYYSDPYTRTEPPRAPFVPTTRKHGTPSSVLRANLPQPYVVHSPISSVCQLNSVSPTPRHPPWVVQEASDSRSVAATSRNSNNGMGRAVPGNANASSSEPSVKKRSGPVKLTPGAKHILVPSGSTGDSNSLPVYSCVSFGSRSGNAAASQNKGT
ncbi:flocculation protein FLO11 [Brachypodium distachyon]|uniref:Uncharacterized protein n=1 Tax=Brachypodium distachyon TaxID=15368 RepID=A0A2K2D772_BRADI|nr:flocculation protein FLO11 [Brachypodium distachyon]PNT70128.1 hypothetical protein BRADI_2g06360v3 [Brachypodium distachyon]PNT70129.1 hypothetical protein BRADI_2g06360v3 [Brachypodium distachyon]|eukprot:XP_003565474.1 flocculation protein FLO11 [Brachypodium distachyon]